MTHDKGGGGHIQYIEKKYHLTVAATQIISVYFLS